MKRRRSFSIFRWMAVILIFIAVVLTVFQLVSFSRIRANFPQGMVIAGVPVGGLSQQQAADRLIQAYGVPVEIRYNNSIIQVKPAVIGFEINNGAMLAAANMERLSQPFWGAFWNYLWNRLPTPSEIPLLASISEERLRSYLQTEIAVRYDQPPSSAVPVAGTVNFQPGQAGTVLDVDRAVVLLSDALRSPTVRIVNLTYNQLDAPRPSIQNLQVLLQQTIDLSGFDGLTEIYLLDLQTGQEINFAVQQGQLISPGIAFTAASTMKIPIMISVYRRLPEPISDQFLSLLEEMIIQSFNAQADELMMTVMDQNLGPLQVTEDMRNIGLQNTFMAGYFYVGAPLLQRISTPANQRTDINTYPDVYNQTTPLEMGMLLEDLYQCAEMGGGTLIAAYPGDITQNECRQMIDLLTRDRIGVLIQAGLPDGTRFAHKHGWTTFPPDYEIDQIADAGVVYSPGGNYILAIYQYHPVSIMFEQDNILVADLSRAIYNYFNLPNQ